MLYAIIFVFGLSASAQGILDRKVESYSAPWGQEFFRLCQTADVPCGVYFAHEEKERKRKGDLRLSRSSVRIVLQEIIKRHPDYYWEVDDGVINLLPKGHRAPLDAEVRSYTAKDVPTETVLSSICRQAGLILGPISIDGYVPPISRLRKISLKLRHTTLKQALNAAVRTDGHAAWILEINRQPDEFAVQAFVWKYADDIKK